MYDGNSQNPTMSTYTCGYHFIGVYGSTYRTILLGKFKKIAGISTITIQARVWTNNADANKEAFVKVDIGGLNNEVTYVGGGTTPAWATPANIDVSSLSNGTTYDITVQLKNEYFDVSSYCSAVVLIAS
jgi:hypothetical protein